MAKTPLLIKSVTLRKMPGFPSGIAAITGLAKNINLIAGPNASGKSSTARAIHQLLWPQDTRRLDLECQLDLNGNNWLIKLDHGEYNCQRDGLTENLPQLPATEESGRYTLALHELVQYDDQDLATIVAREFMGGYNLQKAEFDLGFDHRIKPRTISQAKQYTQTDNTVREFVQIQTGLKEREKKLENLQVEKQTATAAQTLQQLYALALASAQAIQEKETLYATLDHFPTQLQTLHGKELIEMEELDLEINNQENDIRVVAGEIYQTNNQLEALGLPQKGISKELLNELGSRIDLLAESERQLDLLLAEITKGERSVADALKLIDKELEPSNRLDIDLETVGDLDQFLQRAHRIISERQFVESDIAHIKTKLQDKLYPEPSKLIEGIRLLAYWLKEPTTTVNHDPKWLWIIAATGSLAAFAVALFGWVGLIAILILLIMTWLGTRTESAVQTSVRQNDYVKTGLKQPQNWESDQVGLLLEELTEQLQEAQNAALAREEITRQEIALENLNNLAIPIEKERDAWLEILSFLPELPEKDLKNYAGLYWCVTHLATYQRLQIELEGNKVLLSKVKEQHRSHLKRINELLNELHTEIADSPQAKAAHQKLGEDETLRQKLIDSITSLTQRKSDLEAANGRAATKLDNFYQKFGVENGDKEGVRQLVLQLPDFQKLARTCQEKDFEESSKREALVAHEDYHALKEELNSLSPATLLTRLENYQTKASKLEALNEQITSALTLIEQARSGHSLENALFARENTLEALEDAYQTNLASITGSIVTAHLKQANRQQNRSVIFERANELFNQITNGRYELLLSEGEQMAFKAFDTINKQGQDLAILSTGTRIQLLLSVRLAFIESQERDIRLPIIADELLANSDDLRAQQIIEALVKISKEGRQVFYFTSQADEIAKWQAYRDIDPDLEIALFTLDGQASESIDYAAVRKTSAPEIYPEPENMRPREYARLLKLPRFDLLSDNIGRLHLWYIMEDSTFLRTCMQRGIGFYGQFESFLQYGGDLIGLTQPLKELLRTKAKLVEFYQQIYRKGRHLPIDRQVLVDSRIISNKFIDAVNTKLNEVKRDPAALIEALKNGSISGFRSNKVAELETFLIDHEYLKDDIRLEEEELNLQIQAFLSNLHLSMESALQLIDNLNSLQPEL